MLINFLRNKKGQNTAEYALLIALVVAGVIAMQTYAQRALQARVRDASEFMTNQTNALGNSKQYEPYYMKSDYQVSVNSTDNTRTGAGLSAADSESNRTRNGTQETTYNASDMTRAQ